MIFYTPIPLEAVFDGYDQMKLNYKEVQLGHLTMVVEPISQFEGRIVRVISPIADDYLHPQLQPGQILNYQPNFT